MPRSPPFFRYEPFEIGVCHILFPELVCVNSCHGLSILLLVVVKINVQIQLPSLARDSAAVTGTPYLLSVVSVQMKIQPPYYI